MFICCIILYFLSNDTSFVGGASLFIGEFVSQSRLHPARNFNYIDHANTLTSHLEQTE